jgi:hypothetical protein
MTRKRGKKLVNIAPGIGNGKAINDTVLDALDSLSDDIGLTTPQAAKVFGSSAKTLENWRWRGIGPIYRKQGKSVRYSVGAIKAFLAENTIQPRG